MSAGKIQHGGTVAAKSISADYQTPRSFTFSASPGKKTTTFSLLLSMKYAYLALGDSYTIGEQVAIADSFPYQTVQLMRKAGLNCCAPEIIATTGWATNELKKAIDEQVLLATYDFASLLIGVNNQYQGRSIEEFRLHFRLLLEMALERVDGKPDRLVVLSIPDWGVTPYARDKSPEKVRSEIDIYNFICQAEANHFQTRFINITDTQRLDGHQAAYLASDQLHPSGLEYAKWAARVSAAFMETVNHPG